MNASYRHAYLERVFDLLAGPRRDEILARANDLVALWRTTAHMAPYYADRWQQILAMSLEDARQVVFADSDEGEQLRHCMPFAGVLDNRERAELRRLSVEA